MRKLSREVLFKLVFAQNFGIQIEKQTLDELLDVIVQELSAKKEDLDLEYIETAYNYITTNFDSLKQTIERKIPTYKSSRIYNADLIIMVIALYELNETGLDHKIVLSEANKLANKFSTEQSIKFINGVLGSILKDKNE